MGYFARLTRELNKNIILSEQSLDDDKISSVRFLAGTDIVEIYQKNLPEDNDKPITQLPGYKRFYVGKYYRYEQFKQKYPNLGYIWGKDMKTWDGFCETLSDGKLHAIPDRESYPVIELNQISHGKYHHSHGDKTYYIKFYKGNSQRWTERLKSLNLENLQIEEGVIGFKIYAKDESWESVDERNYIIGKLANENEILQAGYNPNDNQYTYLSTPTGIRRVGEKNFILIPPEQIKEGRYIKDTNKNITIEYYRALSGGGEIHWAVDESAANIEDIVFKQGLYRVKFCYKLKDGTIYDEQEFIVGKEISANEAKQKNMDVYKKDIPQNQRFIETAYGIKTVECEKCTIIEPEQLTENKFDPYKNKDFTYLEWLKNEKICNLTKFMLLMCCIIMKKVT